jgi:hypothetical protein
MRRALKSSHNDVCKKKHQRRRHRNTNLRENMQKHSAGEKMKKNRLFTLIKKWARTKRALEF